MGWGGLCSGSCGRLGCSERVCFAACSWKSCCLTAGCCGLHPPADCAGGSGAVEGNTTELAGHPRECSGDVLSLRTLRGAFKASRLAAIVALLGWSEDQHVVEKSACGLSAMAGFLLGTEVVQGRYYRASSEQGQSPVVLPTPRNTLLGRIHCCLCLQGWHFFLCRLNIHLSP